MEAVFKEKSYPANYPADALAIIEAMSFSKGKSVHIMGSMAMRSQQYAGDYDLFEEVQTKGSEHQALRDLADRFKDIVKTLLGAKNVYVGDIKSGAIAEWEILNTNAGIVNGKIANYNAVESNHRIDELEKAKIISGGEAKYARSLIKESMTPEDLIEAKKELKFHIVRWSPQEVIHGSKVLRDKKRYTLEEAFNSRSLTKLDVIGFIENNRFTDFSMIYEFFNKGKALNDFPLNVAQALNEDVIYYKAHGNHFKVLKRMLAIAKLNKDSDAVNKLIPVLNSDLGRLYLIVSDVGTLIELLENERKVPMPLVRFQLDQMKARMGNIYNLPDFLSEEHDLIGDINAILKMTNKSQLLSRLHQIKTKMEGILNTNAKAKGGRRGGATRQERALASEMRAKYFLELGRDATGRVNRPEIYKYLSAIIHDADPRPIAGDPATQSLSVITDDPGFKQRTPDQKNRIRELAKYILREEKLTGFPINRAEWRGAEPANPDMLPVNLKPLGFQNTTGMFGYDFEEEPVGVWDYYLRTGLATADDKALLPKDATGATKPFPNFQTGSPADYRAYFGADYDRLQFPPPPRPPQPPPPIDVIGQQFAGQFPPLAPSVSPTDPALAQQQAENAQLEQRLSQLKAQAEAIFDPAQLATSPNYLLLTEELRKKKAEIGERMGDFPQIQAEAQAEAQDQFFRSDEFDSYVRGLTDTALGQAQGELQAERRAYEASEAGRAEAQARADAEQARLAQEAQARAEAEASAREQSRVEGEERARQAEVSRAEIARLEAEAQSKKTMVQDEAKVFEDIKNAFADKANMAKIPASERDAVKQLLKAVEKGKVANENLALYSGQLAEKKAMEEELKKNPSKKRRGEIKFAMDLMPDDLEKIIADSTRQKAQSIAAIDQLAEIHKKHLRPADVELTRVSHGQSKPGEEVENLSTNPFYTPEETASTIAQIKEPDGKGIIIEIGEVKDMNENIADGVKYAIRMADAAKKAFDDKKLSQADFEKEYDILPKKAVEQTAIIIFSTVLGNPSYPLIARHNPLFGGILQSGAEGMMDEPLKNPNQEKKRLLIRGMIKERFDKEKFFQNLFGSFASVPDNILLTITLMSQEIADVLSPPIKGSIRLTKDFLKQVEMVFGIMLNAGPAQDQAYFLKPTSPKLLTWLQNTRAILAGYTPLERNLCFTSVAMKVSQGEQFGFKFPPEWFKGQIVFPEGLSGSGRHRRGGKLPRSGVLSEDRATRQKELRAMTREELNSMRDVSLADKQLFYAIHTEIPIGDVPFHKKARDAIQAMRDTIARETAIPQIPYGEASPALGQRGMVLKPPNTQYKYFRWVYPMLRPEYVAQQRAKGVSDLAIRYNTREKEYITDWLDTPTPPSYFGKPGMIGNHTVIGVEDWGVEKRPNPTPKREAAGRVRGGKSFARMMAELK